MKAKKNCQVFEITLTRSLKLNHVNEINIHFHWIQTKFGFQMAKLFIKKKKKL